MATGKDHAAISVGQSFWLGCWAGGWTEHKPPSPTWRGRLVLPKLVSWSLFSFFVAFFMCWLQP